ncbi:olfactory receptor 6N2-like [Ictalurus punctatus]|uniref:Olfactory receptor 6N2-like n=1 Tax=Ictalurus punctatus TaxID=7998 RepID=A0A9F7R086_ICTPU|nr:olfactory receptor 6N2-like [Ictalurus punctatus]
MDFTNVTYLTLNGHVDLQTYRYFYFLITLTVYISIIVFNTAVIFVIFMNKRLHEPMYIFIAALLCNALFGATALYPKLLIDLLSEKQVSSYHGCSFQAFCVYTYAASEFMLLSAMAYDRYVSICKPLHYSNIVKMPTVRKLICFSCIAIFPPVIFIIYSYMRILAVCLKNSKDFRRKALQTCLPHLIIFINFSVNMCFEMINSRLESKQIPHIIAIILSVEYLLIPPLFNPIIYGLKLQEILKSIKRLILWKKRAEVYF